MSVLLISKALLTFLGGGGKTRDPSEGRFFCEYGVGHCESGDCLTIPW